MGTLNCGRCGDCMSDRYSPEYGYLCYECFEELVASGVDTDIEAFMRAGKRTNKKEAAEAYFNEIFPSRHEDAND